MAIDDAADLLGNSELPVLHGQQGGLSVWLQNSLILFIVAGALTVTAWCVLDNQSYYTKWREEKYRKRVRRKYGIPDSDRDVFNVAYANAKKREADAARAAAAAEVSNRRPIAPVAPVVPPVLSAPSSNSRQRATPQAEVFPTFKRPTVLIPEQHDHVRSERRPHTPILTRGGGVPQRANAQLNVLADQSMDNIPRKQPVENGVRAHKRDREEVDDEADILMNFEDDVLGGIQEKSKRGSKRHAGPEDDATPESARKKSGKRPRRISRRTQDLLLDLEENERADQVMELDEATLRGKKRDRTEAGSTFGGDDDSPQMHGRKTRRKRRSTANAEAAIEAQARGTKRVHDVESTLDSDEDDRASRSRSLRKRNRHFLPDGDSSTDVSMDGPTVVVDPSCAGHKIGEEWSANGQLFKVGSNGKRLRQVLVKKRRSRYSMPTDSQHPDTQAQMVVLMETWMDDDTFAAAEERGDVFSTKKPDEEVLDVDNSPAKSGKTLLWTSTTKKGTSPKKAFKDSIVTNVGLSINPFDRPSYNSYSRRVSTGHGAFKQSGAQSPTILQHSKSYSKWEKQDLEAEAMAKLRKKLEEQKKSALAPSEPKKVTFKIPESVSAPAMASSFTAPAATTETTTKPATISLNASTEQAKPLQSIVPSATAPQLSASTSSPFGTNNPATQSSTEAKPPGPFFTTQASQPASTEKPFSFAPTSSTAPQTETKVSNSTFAPSAGTTPASNPFGGIKAVENNSQGSNAPSFKGFGNPSGGNAPNAFSIKGAAQVPTSSPFAASPFGGVSNDKNATAQPANSASSTTKSILFGMPPPSSSLGTTANPASVSTPSAFGVSKNTFGDPSKASAPAPSPAASSTEKPQFSFGFGTKPATPVPTSTASSTEVTKPNNTGFKFNNPTQAPSSGNAFTNPTSAFPPSASPSSSGAAQPSTAAPAPTTFSFGSNAPSTKMTTKSEPIANASSTGNTQATPSQPPLTFNFGAASTGATSTTPNTTPSTSSNAFGAAAKSPPIFGGPSKQSDVPKPLFGFGSGSGGGSTTPSAPGPVGTPGTDTGKTEKHTFSFNFNTPSSTPATGGSSTTATAAQSNPFGVKPAVPTTFAFGSNTGGGTGNLFGQTAAGGNSAFSGASKNVFGGTTGSAFGGQANNNTSSNGQSS